MAKWLKRWTTDPGVPGSSPTIATGIFSPRSLLSSAQKSDSLPDFYTADAFGEQQLKGVTQMKPFVVITAILFTIYTQH